MERMGDGAGTAPTTTLRLETRSGSGEGDHLVSPEINSPRVTGMNGMAATMAGSSAPAFLLFSRRGRVARFKIASLGGNFPEDGRSGPTNQLVFTNIHPIKATLTGSRMREGE
ncbi:hypothetical protein VNO77_02497 [Canavalia gladiata]|uniref:Uncharacterized protein n=1 Tax=Canavalia gladiata TaxID=3824 RepID=A0AAN9R7A5_CANGL